MATGPSTSDETEGPSPSRKRKIETLLNASANPKRMKPSQPAEVYETTYYTPVSMVKDAIQEQPIITWVSKEVELTGIQKDLAVEEVERPVPLGDNEDNITELTVTQQASDHPEPVTEEQAEEPEHQLSDELRDQTTNNSESEKTPVSV